MRIECDNCSAAFTIGDSLLSDQPIGAQCPYCGHVRVVKRGDPASTKAAPPSPNSAPPTFGSLTGSGPQALYTPPSSPPGLDQLPRPAAGPRSLGPFHGLSGDLGPPFGSTGNTGPVTPLNRSGNTGPAPRLDRFGATSEPISPPSAPPPEPSSGGASCQVCGTALVDEFDKVIGLCETHQRERSAQPDGLISMPPPPEAAGGREWRVRQRDGGVIGPLTLAQVRDGLNRREYTDGDAFAKGDYTFNSLDHFADLKSFAKAMPDDGKPRGRSAVGPRQGPSFGTLLLGAILIGVLGFGGYVILNPSIAEDLLARLKGEPEAIDTTQLPPNPFKRLLDQWKSAHPDASGTPEEHLVSAKARHLEDNWKGYQLAQDGYQRAILLQPDNARAIAGYVENLALWKGRLLSDDELRLLEAAIRFALAVAPNDASVLRGRAALSLSRADLNACRSAADRALTVDPRDAQARLLLSSSFLEGNPGLAVREAESALRQLPQLRRADRVLARAYANAGRYASALKLLDQRVASESDNGGVLWLRGDLRREIADFAAAAQDYRRAMTLEGDQAGGRVALGELLVETSDPRAAIEVVRSVVEGGKAPAKDRTRALDVLARIEIDAGRPKRAKEYAQAALALDARDPVALVMLAEVALHSGTASAAEALAKRALEERAGEPSALIALARAKLLQKNFKVAVKHAEEAKQNDPRDPRLSAILASVYLATGGSSEAAFTVMRQASEIDPLERESRNRKTLLALVPGSLNEAIARFREAAKELRDRSVSNSSIALIHYHSGEFAKAREALELSLQTDESNSMALLYKAQLALDRGAYAEGEKIARELLRSERGSPVGQLVLGRAMIGLGKPREAEDVLDAALRSNPGLFAAEVERAGLLLADKRNDKAIEILNRVFGVNSHMLRVRQFLLKAGY